MNGKWESGNENVLFVCMCIPFPVFKDGQLENTEGLTAWPAADWQV